MSLLTAVVVTSGGAVRIADRLRHLLRRPEPPSLTARPRPAGDDRLKALTGRRLWVTQEKLNLLELELKITEIRYREGRR